MGNTVKFEEIAFTDAVFSNIKTAQQNWNNIPKWVGYAKKPRKNNGIVFITSDMIARYIMADGQSFEASRGDAVFVPKDGSKPSAAGGAAISSSFVHWRTPASPGCFTAAITPRAPAWRIR